MKHLNKIVLCVLTVSLVFSLCACARNSMLTYYRDEQNYSDFSGELTFINFTSDDALYLGFDQITPKTSDTSFKLVGKNFEIANEYDLKELLVIGKTVQFVTAPEYFGDGYVMPIVGLTVDGTVILDKETGIKNWIDWLTAH